MKSNQIRFNPIFWRFQLVSPLPTTKSRLKTKLWENTLSVYSQKKKEKGIKMLTVNKQQSAKNSIGKMYGASSIPVNPPIKSPAYE